ALRSLLTLLLCWSLSLRLTRRLLLPITLAAKHLHGSVDSDQNLRGVSLDSVLLPLASAQLAFDIKLLALGDVLADDLRQLAAEHNAVPLGALLLLAGLLVLPALRCGQSDVGECDPAWRV